MKTNRKKKTKQNVKVPVSTDTRFQLVQFSLPVPFRIKKEVTVNLSCTGFGLNCNGYLNVNVQLEITNNQQIFSSLIHSVVTFPSRFKKYIYVFCLCMFFKHAVFPWTRWRPHAPLSCVLAMHTETNRLFCLYSAFILSNFQHNFWKHVDMNQKVQYLQELGRSVMYCSQQFKQDQQNKDEYSYDAWCGLLFFILPKAENQITTTEQLDRRSDGNPMSAAWWWRSMWDVTLLNKGNGDAADR